MPIDTPTPLEAAEAASADALATMESEAAAFFAARDEAREPLNPVAPALERAAPASAKPSSAAASTRLRGKQASLVYPTPTPAPSQTPATAASRVPGAPRLTGSKPGTPTKGEAAGAVASPEVVDASAKESAPAIETTTPPEVEGAPDISDLPTSYVPGTLRAPHWERLRANRDHFEALSVSRHQEAEDLRAQLAELRSNTAAVAPPELTQRLQALQGERDALRTQLQSVAGERIFDTESKPRREAAIAQAKAAAGPEAARVEQLLALQESIYRDEQLESVIASLPSLRATKLASAVAELDRLATERMGAAAQGGELWQRRMAAEGEARERANAERIARATTTFEAELKEWEVAGVTPPEIEAARSVYTGKDATLQDASRAALWGAVGPRVAVQLQASEARVAELEGQLAKLRALQPSLGSHGSGALPTSNGDEDDDPSVTSYADRIAKQALRGGVRFGAS